MPDLSTITPEQRAALLAELSQQVEASEDADLSASSGPDLAAFLAVPYRVGDIEIRPLTINTLAVLEYLGNPMLTDDAETADPWAVYEFLYVLSHPDGARLAASGYEHSRRLRLIRESQEIAAKSPDYYERYLAALDHVTVAYFGEWDAAIQAFSARLDGVGVAELREVVRRVISDATRGNEPDSDEPEDAKKNVRAQQLM